MRKKIKQVLCMISALVVMICCAIPAFADDTVAKNDLSSVKWNIVSSSSDIYKFDFLYNRYQSSIKTDNYIAISAPVGDYKWTFIIPFDSSAIVNTATDSVVVGGENGLLYNIKLNTNYDKNNGNTGE